MEICCVLEEHHDGQMYFAVLDRSSTSSAIYFAHESKAKKIGSLALDLDDSDHSQAEAFADIV